MSEQTHLTVTNTRAYWPTFTVILRDEQTNSDRLASRQCQGPRGTVQGWYLNVAKVVSDAASSIEVAVVVHKDEIFSSEGSKGDYMIR
ncbi:hypothetical protein ANN_10722 [Periplaneta americana]|uniref:Uncharacterized protein n=1 Tax=Periplaneta americana TaxID=6978 RepID=A0ABQ8T324_PERAM|nr:hypothetical protein ANN_10722 [Periplaneta americana]